MPDLKPQALHQPTRLLSRPRPATSSMADLLTDLHRYAEAAAVMREIAPAASTPQDEHAESPPRHATGCPSWSPPARWRYPDTRRALTSADGLWRPRSVRRIRETAGPTAPTASGIDVARRHDATAQPDARAAPAGARQ